MDKHKIALIVEEISQSYQKEILDGINSAAQEKNFDVYAFTSFSSSANNARHNDGEYNIFNLPDFKSFDGAILLTNTLTDKKAADNIINTIKQSKIPVVSIDNNIDSFYHIGIDNTAAMRNITEHMIKEHGHRVINYISGPKENPESKDRLKGFLAVLKENGIEPDEDRIYYGDFRAPSGKAAIKQFVNCGKDMPSAIICANDVMAVAAINKLTALNYSVPDKIAVTGFDNTYLSNNYQVELTSVGRPLTKSGEIAIEMLYNHFKKIQQKKSRILEMEYHYTESCGCIQFANKDLAHYKRTNYLNYARYERSQEFMSSLNKFSCDIKDCNNYTEYIRNIKEFCSKMNPDEFYLCLCEEWSNSTYDINEIEEVLTVKSVPVNYTEKMLVPIAYKNGKYYEFETIYSKDIIPHIDDSEEKGKLLYIIPLHSAERCLGYMVLRTSNMSINNSAFETFCIYISNSLENMRKMICLEGAIKHLDKLYAQDTFSGIYNRNGFVKGTNELYQNCIKEKKSIMLMFIDLDGLKKINDTFGHSIGDRAICCIAEVLRKSCTRGEVFCRFGGDEFIVFGADYTEEYAVELTQKINNNIDDINIIENYPFILSASIGHIIDIPKPEEDIFSFVSIADKEMYAEKKKKKKSNYLKEYPYKK